MRKPQLAAKAKAAGLRVADAVKKVARLERHFVLIILVVVLPFPLVGAAINAAVLAVAV